MYFMKRVILLLVLGMMLIGIMGLVSAIPNPAPVYCSNMGYTTNETSCIFSDGNSCEVWSFYNGLCGQQYVKNLSCIEKGGSLSPGYKCCEELSSIGVMAGMGSDGICMAIAGAWNICSPCGNGVCDSETENKCNCPQDCNQTINPTGHGPTGCEKGTTWDSGVSLCKSCSAGKEPYLDGSVWKCKNVVNKTNIIGGQRDSYGCLGPAGYSWNATEQKCVREWEKGNERYQNEIERKNNSGIGLGQIIRNRVRAGVYTTPKGYEIRVFEMAQNRIRLMVRNKSADCDGCNITEERVNNRTILIIHLSNGKEKIIIIMPDKASERALERLKLNVCNESNNCTIELKEVGKGNQTRIAYEIQVQRHFKLLGLFSAKALEKAQVDSETGDTVIIIKKPWWAFLATSSD